MHALSESWFDLQLSEPDMNLKGKWNSGLGLKDGVFRVYDVGLDLRVEVRA